MKYISLLGSTGSIGKNVLNVVRHLGPEKLEIVGLAAGSNIELLYEQALEFKPKIIGVHDEKKAAILAKRLPNIQVVSTMEGIKEVATHPDANLVVNSIVGNDGLSPMLAAISAKKDIALANKEVLVSAGELIMSACKKNNCTLIPIDSEHSAIFQCLQGQPIENVSRIVLTASGGPFRNHSADALKNVSLQEALNHPTWSMGSKVTIDSSTLMNKGFEVIEAHWLFGIPMDKIDVIIHPQSIIHSMVEFVDNTLLAQMGEPTMVVPIQYALTYPEKYPGTLSPFDFTRHNHLQFFEPNFDRFACLKLAYEAQNQGGSFPCFLNAANETLVERFLSKKIRWIEISKKLQQLLERHKKQQIESVEQILEIDRSARMEAQQI
ncbi:MAG: 1-deoxy-D-xylulose 5-phosphate reductoisomerase [Chlamydiae bacterium]|nr:1-deoxy-D-xylulose 5-phosphate reductoisomerase [Chlamydiota bacterium]